MIFIDTSGLLALWLEGDSKHDAAVAAMDALRADRERFSTSNFILDEVVTLAGRRAGARFAVARARNILDAKVLAMLRPDAEDERFALTLYEKFFDQGVGFTDAVSFALMRRHRIKRAFTFDRHFADAGFTLFPS